MPEVQLEWMEIICFGVTALSIIGAALMGFEYFQLYFGSTRKEHGSMVQTLFDVLYSLPIICLLIYIILCGFKYTLKKSVKSRSVSVVS